MDIDTNLRLWSTIFTILNTVLLIAITIACIYGFILFVKLVRRGIKAADIYSKKNRIKLLIPILLLIIFSYTLSEKTPTNAPRVKPQTATADWIDHYGSASALIQNADIIIRGKNIKNTPEQRANMIFTRADIAIEKSYKGNMDAKDVISVIQTGGTFHGLKTLPFPEAPLFEINNEYLLFLEKADSDDYIVMGGFQGTGRIEGDCLDFNVISDSAINDLQGKTILEVEKIIKEKSTPSSE